MRHTCATLLLQKGVNPRILQEMLGHAAISITLGTHSHVLPAMQQGTVVAMEEVLEEGRGGDSPSPPPAGTGVAHAFVVDSGEVPEFLSIGARGQRRYPLYPGSGKLLVATLVGEAREHESVVERPQKADYLDDEP